MHQAILLDTFGSYIRKNRQFSVQSQPWRAAARLRFECQRRSSSENLADAHLKGSLLALRTCTPCEHALICYLNYFRSWIQRCLEIPARVQLSISSHQAATLVWQWPIAMSLHKRKSNSGQGGSRKSQKAEGDLKVPVQALLQEQVKLFDQWLPFGCSMLALLPTQASLSKDDPKSIQP